MQHLSTMLLTSRRYQSCWTSMVITSGETRCAIVNPCTCVHACCKVVTVHTYVMLLLARFPHVCRFCTMDSLDVSWTRRCSLDQPTTRGSSTWWMIRFTPEQEVLCKFSHDSRWRVDLGKSSVVELWHCNVGEIFIIRPLKTALPVVFLNSCTGATEFSAQAVLCSILCLIISGMHVEVCMSFYCDIFCCW